METHGNSMKSIVTHGNPRIPLKSMEFNELQCDPWKPMDSIVIHGNPWKSAEINGNQMKYKGIK